MCEVEQMITVEALMYHRYNGFSGYAIPTVKIKHGKIRNDK
jgi:hypothetical protein